MEIYIIIGKGSFTYFWDRNIGGLVKILNKIKERKWDIAVIS